jgi:hypothetical protein
MIVILALSIPVNLPLDWPTVVLTPQFNVMMMFFAQLTLVMQLVVLVFTPLLTLLVMIVSLAPSILVMRH